MSPSDEVITTRRLTKRYGNGSLAVADLDLSVRRGGVYGFVGPSLPRRLALAAVRQFINDSGQVPTAHQWAAAGLSRSEKTVRHRFGSFRAAARLAGEESALV